MEGKDNRRILVIGDSCHDRFVFGRTKPGGGFVESRNVVKMDGMAGNVLRHVEKLHGSSVAFSLSDSASFRWYYIDEASGAVVFRADTDSSPEAPLSRESLPRPEGVGLVVVADYDKGFLTEELLAAIPAMYPEALCVVSSKKKSTGWSLGYTCMACNEDEALGKEGNPGRNCLWRGLVVTHGHRGAMAYDGRGHPRMEPAVPAATGGNHVGCGDAFLAGLALFLFREKACRTGEGMPDAAVRFANTCGAMAASSPTTGSLEGAWGRHEAYLLSGVFDRAPAARGWEEARKRRREGGKVAFTNGCFDIFHHGHLKLLRESRNMAGGFLAVGLNTDKSVEALKGGGRPVHGYAARADMLLATGLVDALFPVDSEEGLDHLVHALSPDFLVKGDEWKGRDVVGSGHAGSLVFVGSGAEPRASSTAILQERRRVAKAWGTEEVLANGPYCMKVIRMHGGASGSLHYHKSKAETFYVLRGRLAIEVDGLARECRDGDVVHVLPGQAHRMSALEDSAVAEASTFDAEEDTFRIAPSVPAPR
jgi:rfaE bifunctional protein nucleotidyltransferase chain/domain